MKSAEESDLDMYLEELQKEEEAKKEMEEEWWEFLEKEKKRERKERKELSDYINESIHVVLMGLRPK